MALLLAVLLGGGCGRDEIKSYHVPKEQPPREVETSLPAGHSNISAPGPEAGPRLQWNTPDGWKEVPPSEFRVASFQVAGKDGRQADVSVIPLPGSAGGDLSNVNRWRGQVGQKPVSAEELAKLVQAVEVAGQPAALFEQSGENPQGEPTGILAVIYHRDGTAWFFKMTGDRELVAQSKPVFVEFLKSLQFVTGAAAPVQRPVGSGSLPPGHPDISGMAAGAPPEAASSDGKPRWTVPPGWKEVPGGQFLVAKFVIDDESNAQAAVNVSSSAGDGGGLAANVNRWRKQLGLNDLSTDELAKETKVIETSAGKATLVEMAGQDARSNQPASVVGAIVLRPGQAWFYKLMGDSKTVVAQKEAFLQFVREVKY